MICEICEYYKIEEVLPMRYQLPRGYRRYLLGLAMLALLCIAAAVTVFLFRCKNNSRRRNTC